MASIVDSIVSNPIRPEAMSLRFRWPISEPTVVRQVVLRVLAIRGLMDPAPADAAIMILKHPINERQTSPLLKLPVGSRQPSGSVGQAPIAEEVPVIRSVLVTSMKA